MGADFGSLNTALSGLMAHRKSAEVIGHNISNTNTEGFSRQRVDLKAAGANAVPAVWSRWDRSGAGVDTGATLRIRDDFLERRYLTEEGTRSDLDRAATVLHRVEMAFPEPSDEGLATQLAEYWASWDDVANAPDSLPARSALLERGRTVAQTVNRMAGDLIDLRDSLVLQAEAYIADVNSMAKGIAELNDRIQAGTAAGLYPNDLMDQRDLLVTKVSTIAGVTTRTADFGMVDVMIGGAMLVRGKTADELELVLTPLPIPAPAPDPDAALRAAGFDKVQVQWTKDKYPVTFTGGELKAQIEGANSVVPSYLVKLNETAETLADQVNSVHQTGYGLDDVLAPPPARDFFDYTATNLAVADPYQRPAATLALALAVDGQPRNIAAAASPGTLDGSKAQALAEYPHGATAGSGVDDVYKRLIGDLGVDTQAARRRSDIQTMVTNQVNESRKAVSGVNIDEEMVSLVQAQHAYNASARLMTTIDEMLQTLISGMGVVGR